MMNIALGFDKNYAKYAVVTIKSIICNNSEPIEFYLMIDKSVPLYFKHYIKKIIESSNNRVKFFDMTKLFKKNFTGQWSKAMYYPIMLSDLCDDDRILFLDSDTIVTSNLENFYHTDLENYFCGAVHDYAMKSWIKSHHTILLGNNNGEKAEIDKYFSQIRKWDDEDIERYFNSGVLLLNLDEIRKYNAKDKMLEILENEKLACPDQDCFNICFHDKVKIMSPDYNFLVISKEIYNNLPEREKNFYDSKLKESHLPCIIHFLQKPWMGNIKSVPYYEQYYKYRDMTVLKYSFEKYQMQKFIRLKLSTREIYLYILGHHVFSRNHAGLS